MLGSTSPVSCIIGGNEDQGIWERATAILQGLTVDYTILANWTRSCSMHRPVPADVYDKISAFSQLYTNPEHLAHQSTFGTTLFPVTYRFDCGDEYNALSDDSPIAGFRFEIDGGVELPFTPEDILQFLGSKYSITTFEREILAVRFPDPIQAEEEASHPREFVINICQIKYDLFSKLYDISYYLSTFHIQAFGSAVRVVADILVEHESMECHGDVCTHESMQTCFGYKIHEHAAMWCLPLANRNNSRVVLVFRFAIRARRDVPLWLKILQEFVSDIRMAKQRPLAADFYPEQPEQFADAMNEHPVHLGDRYPIGYLTLYAPLSLFRKPQTVSNLISLPQKLNRCVIEMKMMLHQRLRAFHKRTLLKLEDCRTTPSQAVHKYIEHKLIRSEYDREPRWRHGSAFAREGEEIFRQSKSGCGR